MDTAQAKKRLEKAKLICYIAYGIVALVAVLVASFCYPDLRESDPLPFPFIIALIIASLLVGQARIYAIAGANLHKEPFRFLRRALSLYWISVGCFFIAAILDAYYLLAPIMITQPDFLPAYRWIIPPASFHSLWRLLPGASILLFAIGITLQIWLKLYVARYHGKTLQEQMLNFGLQVRSVLDKITGIFHKTRENA